MQSRVQPRFRDPSQPWHFCTSLYLSNQYRIGQVWPGQAEAIQAKALQARPDLDEAVAQGAEAPPLRRGVRKREGAIALRKRARDEVPRDDAGGGCEQELRSSINLVVRIDTHAAKMPFADHIGPDASRRKNAWGAGSGVGKRATKKNATRTHPNPKIVTTTQRAHNYRSAYCPNMTPMAGASRERSEDLPPLRSPNVTRKPKTVRLASSMARPKARPVVPPPRAGAWKKNAKNVHVSTPFRNFYDRGDIPVCIDHGAKRRVQWKVSPADLDYHHYLPMFFEGLRETREPYVFLAHSGTLDLLDQGGEKVLAVVPQLVMPIKKALNTKNRKTIGRVLQVLQHLARCAPFIGEALVPYYRQILPVFNLVLLLDPRDNLGDQIDYGQQKRENLVDLILETLEVLEETGGRDAYINIKYQIPSYESSVHA